MVSLAVGEKGGDWSLATPTDAQLKNAGLVFGIRYCAPLNADGTLYGPSAAKVIRQPEYDRLQGKILRVLLLNYEWYEGRMAEGTPAGRQDAGWAATWAHGLGYPVGWPIPFSDDTNNTPYSAVKAYLQAAQAQLDSMPGGYVAGYYGRQANCTLVAADFPKALVWQTCAWSGGVYGGTAPLYQDICNYQTPIPGVDIDFVKKPITLPGEDMPLDATDLAAIAKLIDDHVVSRPYVGLTNIHDLIINSGNTVRDAVGAVSAAVQQIPTVPVDQAALERAVVAAVEQALAGGVPAGTVEAEVLSALGKATLPVALTGTAGTPPVVP